MHRGPFKRVHAAHVFDYTGATRKSEPEEIFMLKRNLVAAICCATFSLAMSQSVAAGALSQEEFNKMAEEAMERQQDPAAMPAPEPAASGQAETRVDAGRSSAVAPMASEATATPPRVPSAQPPVPRQQQTAVEPPGQRATAEERRAFFAGRDRDLRESAGRDMPGRPPWAGRGMGMGRQFMTDEERAAHREAMRTMSPEERQAYRAQMHERMRERAWEEGVVLPEAPPWEGASAQMQPAPPSRPSWADRMAGYRDRVGRMSPEDREACQALTRMEMREHMRHMMREMSARMSQYRSEYTPRQFPQAGYGQDYPYAPEGDYGQGYPMAPGAGYGYGSGRPSPWGGRGAGPMAPPAEDFGSGYPSAPGFGSGYGSPWGYGR